MLWHSIIWKKEWSQRHCGVDHTVAEAEFRLFSISILTLRQLKETRLNSNVEEEESKTLDKMAPARFFFSENKTHFSHISVSRARQVCRPAAETTLALPCFLPNKALVWLGSCKLTSGCKSVVFWTSAEFCILLLLDVQGYCFTAKDEWFRIWKLGKYRRLKVGMFKRKVQKLHLEIEVKAKAEILLPILFPCLAWSIHLVSFNYTTTHPPLIGGDDREEGGSTRTACLT